MWHLLTDVSGWDEYQSLVQRELSQGTNTLFGAEFSSKPDRYPCLVDCFKLYIPSPPFTRLQCCFVYLEDFEKFGAKAVNPLVRGSLPTPAASMFALPANQREPQSFREMTAQLSEEIASTGEMSVRDIIGRFLAVSRLLIEKQVCTEAEWLQAMTWSKRTLDEEITKRKTGA